MSTLDLHLFARPTVGPFSIQVIGDPAGGPVAPFALVQRYSDQLDHSERGAIDINGWKVGVATYDNDNGEARWNLADGGQGYLRSRGLDRDTLVGIVGALTARDATAVVPGFDYTPVEAAAPRLQLLAEHLNTNVTGWIASYECQVAATSYIYRIAAIDGDPVFQYAAVIDRPAPIEIGYRQGTLIVIGGIGDPAAPTVADVDNAAPEAWLQLLAAPLV
jgi:hypothetical protein